MFEISEFKFLRPIWLILIPIFCWLIYISYKKLFRISNWDSLIDSHLLDFLVTKPKNKRNDLIPWLLFFVVTLFLIALAGPVWKKIPQPIFQKKHARVIVLDLSYSMLARDVSPTRIDRVRFKLVDLLKSFKEGETGLICYAGDAFVISPLTNDPSTIVSMLPGLSPNIMPVPGSNPEIAIKLAVDLINRSGLNNGHIILVTDGIEKKSVSNLENLLGPNNLSILAVGTGEGSPINLPGGDFLKDKNGNIVIPKLNKKSLLKLSNIYNFTLVFMSMDDKDIEKIISSEDISMDYIKDTTKITSDRWEEEGPWLLLIALPLASLIFRRGVLFSFPFLIFFLISYNPKSLVALEWDKLWMKDDQIAKKYFDDGDMEKASKIFKNEQWKGVASYRSGDYENAIKFFSKLDTPESTYNLANSYAMTGRLNESLKTYNKLLKKYPGHKDAKYNKELIEKMIRQKNEKKQRKNKNNSNEKRESLESEQLQKQIKEKNNIKDKNFNLKQKDSLNKQNSNKNKKNIEKKYPKINEENKNKKKNKNSNLKKNNYNDKIEKNHENIGKKNDFENKDSLTTKKYENQRLEQWLRKIPDDPGRLLRNKMKFEFQRRGKSNLQNNIYW